MKDWGIVILGIILLFVIIPVSYNLGRNSKNEISCDSPTIKVRYSNHSFENYDDLEAIAYFTRWTGETFSLEDGLLITRTINKYNNTVLSSMDILALIALESNFKKNAINFESKDYGIAQINERTYFHFCKDNCKIENLFDIEYNIRMMLTVLKSKESRLMRYETFNDYLLRKYLIMSYNKGVGGFLGSYFLSGEDSYYLELVENRKRGVLRYLERK